MVSSTGSILPYAGVGYGTGSGIGSPLAYQGSGSPLAYGGSGSPLAYGGSGSPLAYGGSGSPLAYGGSGSSLAYQGSGSPLAYGGSPYGGYTNQASIIASSIAGAGIASPLAFAAPIHIPTLVQHPSGAVTPADEPAVVAARADHLRAKAVAYVNEAQSIAAGAYGSGAYGVTGQIY